MTNNQTGAPERRTLTSRLPALRLPTASGWVTGFALVAMTVFVVVQLHPNVLFSGTLTDGGDMGAHVYLPWFMRHSLIGQGRITGWSPGWYAGFPVFTFYFPLPSLFIAITSFVIPYAVAFKLVTASGLVIMPVSAWAMAKLAGWKPPVPIAMAAATLPLLFERSFTIDGGNIASTMAGEYTFAISLSVGLILLGLVARGLDTGRHRGLAAVLFAVVAMCHVLPAMFVAACAVLLLILQMGRKPLWWGLSAGVAGAALTAVWLLPFEWRIGYSTDMGWSPVTDFAKCLFPYQSTSQCTTTAHSEVIPFAIFVGLGVIGAVISVVGWARELRLGGWGSGGPHRLGVVLALMGAASAGTFVLAPASAVYNARALPFWFLCVYLLSGIAVGETAAGIGMLWRRWTVGRLAANWWIGADMHLEASPPTDEASGALTMAPPPPDGVTRLAVPPYPVKTWHPGALAGAIVATLLALYYVALPLRIATWLPGTVPVAQKSFVPDWVTWNYSGYQSRATWPEYHALMNTMGKVGARYGCGRAMWEYDPSENNFGTPMALMLLPYWTNGCVDSMEGLLFESSSTTPYHFVNQSELSDSPSDAMRNIPYAGMNEPLGIEHLQLLGVRYFMAFSYDVKSTALADPRLRLIATSGPWSGAQSMLGSNTPTSWDIFEVKDSSVVAPLTDQPAVMTGTGFTGQDWLDASMAWYTNPSRWSVPLTAGGPASWQRVAVTTTPTTTPTTAGVSTAVAGEGTTIATPRTVPLPVVHVSHVVVTTHSVSFDVDRTGVPVMVRTSYFPNWQASGATGPYRATPNEMVVVPTAHHVVVHYGYTPVDIIGWLLTLAGLAGVVVMVRRPPLLMPAGRVAGAAPPMGGAGDPPDAAGGQAVPIPSGMLDQGMGKATGQLGAIFKAYDVRGTVPDQLDFPICRAIGVGFALFLRLGGNLGAKNQVLVARDMRESGVELAGAFMAGVRSQGVDVVDLGLASTDMVYFSSGVLDAPAAVFTASHNPARYNGIKFCLPGARPVGVETGLAEIEKIAEGVLGPEWPKGGALFDPVANRADRAVGVNTPPPGSLVSINMLDAFANHVRSFVDVSALSGMKIVADTANGMGGLVVPAVFAGIDADLEILYPELDGSFPNHPADPIQPENLADLVDRVVETGADIGLAFDGDADRVFLVDEKGVPLSGSLTTAMVARSMLAKHPRATILYNVICSKTVREVIAEGGGTGVRTRVGHSFIKSIMAETGAVFGGEHSGHYYFRENYRADSGLIAALVVLEMLAASGKPLSELRQPFERYSASGEINTEVADPGAVIAAVEDRFRQEPGATLDHLDGLTVEMGDWWFNIRPSNTEPLLRLNLEAPDEGACAEHVDEVLGMIDQQASTTTGGRKSRGGWK